MNRKLVSGIVLPTVLLAVGLSTVSCDTRPKTTGEKVEDAVKDGLDARPGEKIRDAGEDVKDAAEDAVK